MPPSTPSGTTTWRATGTSVRALRSEVEGRRSPLPTVTRVPVDVAPGTAVIVEQGGGGTGGDATTAGDALDEPLPGGERDAGGAGVDEPQGRDGAQVAPERTRGPDDVADDVGDEVGRAAPGGEGDPAVGADPDDDLGGDGLALDGVAVRGRGARATRRPRQDGQAARARPHGREVRDDGRDPGGHRAADDAPTVVGVLVTARPVVRESSTRVGAIACTPAVEALGLAAYQPTRSTTTSTEDGPFVTVTAPSAPGRARTVFADRGSCRRS